MDREPYRLTVLETKRISRLRSGCEACGGDPELCMAGNKDFDRLEGCRAFTKDGRVAPLAPRVRQPWELEEAA